jgi:hypothetical protein
MIMRREARAQQAAGGTAGSDVVQQGDGRKAVAGSTAAGDFVQVDMDEIACDEPGRPGDPARALLQALARQCRR